MAGASTVVIKVKYRETLRRFNANIVDEKLNITMDGLREKISSLFSFSPETEQILTYIDEDGDVVTLADDEDLLDVVKQSLNPLRITVKLKTEKINQQVSRFSGSSTLRSPKAQQNSPNSDFSEILKNVQEPLRETLLKSLTDLASKSFSGEQIRPQDLNAGVSQILKTVQEPLRETLVKLTADVAPKSATSVPAFAELVDNLWKASLSYLDNLSDSKNKEQPSAQNDASESSKRKESSKKPQPESTIEKANEVKSGNLPSSSTTSVAPKTVDNGKKKMVMKSIDCSSDGKSKNKFSSASVDLYSVAKNVPTEKEVNKLTNPNTEPNIANGCDPESVRGDSLGDRLMRAYCGAPPYPISQHVGSGLIFHHGVRCDGCGAYPITGPRFNSKVKVNYDLCEICFSGIGSDKDYTRMDFPAAYHTPRTFKGLLNKAHGASVMPQLGRVLKDKSGHSKLNSRFIQDVNVSDGTVMAPLTPFTKIWRMRNNGTVVWPSKTQLVWIGGDRLGSGFSFEVEIPEAGIQVDQELDVAVDFTAPEIPGRYISYWIMSSPSGQKFGQHVWVLIQVDASLKETCGDAFPGIILEHLEEPVVDDNPRQPIDSVEFPPNVDHDKKFPINDSLLVGSGASASVSSSVPSISYPVIDLPYRQSVFPSVIPPVDVLPPQPATVATPEELDLTTEEKLLKELENMGFRQVDLNKEVLRLNEYDLAKTVDDLYGVSGWDPMLEQLQEMGFTDTEMNKMLLKKNNGSIKRVVMDLIAGEKKYY